MTTDRYVIQKPTPFAKSLIWQLNRDFYQDQGIKAWSEGVVPHQMTSNSQVGKTYAEMIFAFLKDLSDKNSPKEKVYILELGAGHGRLAFHILKHLERLVQSTSRVLLEYCYVLSDIVEDNLSFFENHPQLESYLKQGQLDIAYFDAIGSNTLDLRYSNKTIKAKDLKNPIIGIANYFFDSIPNDLYYIRDRKISNCSVSIESKVKPVGKNTIDMMGEMVMTYQKEIVKNRIYDTLIFDEILESYKGLVNDTYLFFPHQSFLCIDNVRALSSKGLFLLAMDKGLHEPHKMSGKKEPDIISHGSFSLWVNFHALGSYCNRLGGTNYFPVNSNFNLEIGCLMFLEDGQDYSNTKAAYQQVVNDFGPDDITTIKKFVYQNISRLSLQELLAFFRLTAYDSTIFSKLFPKVKHLSKTISNDERDRLVQTISHVWDMYFYINEPFDLAYETGGVLYDLGAYDKALIHFQQSLIHYGDKADVYYNLALCHYQLRQDELFYSMLNEGKMLFPDSELFTKLMGLDME